MGRGEAAGQRGFLIPHVTGHLITLIDFLDFLDSHFTWTAYAEF